MSAKKASLNFAIAASLSLASIASAYSQTTTLPATISDIYTGWGGDSVRIVTKAPFVNPKVCPNSDGYVMILVTTTTTAIPSAVTTSTGTSTGSSAATTSIPSAVTTSTTSTNGYRTHYQALLSAFALDQPVRIVISDSECEVGRPKILGVYMSKP